MKRAAYAAGVLVALTSGATIAILPVHVAYFSDFRGLSAIELARRLARYHRVGCEPVSAVSHDGRLAVTCAESRSVEFYAELPCSETFACGTLKIDAACWQPAVP